MSQSDNSINSNSGAVIIYDGDCPFCRNYVHILRIKAAIGNVILINAREGGRYVDEAVEKGLDLNEGMALLYNNIWYHGADCINVLSLMSSQVGFVNRIMALIFRNPKRSSWLYPVLRFGRNTTLKILGIKQINQ